MFICRAFTAEDSAVILPVNVTVYGDVTIALKHAQMSVNGKVRCSVLKNCV